MARSRKDKDKPESASEDTAEPGAVKTASEDVEDAVVIEEIPADAPDALVRAEETGEAAAEQVADGDTSGDTEEDADADDQVSDEVSPTDPSEDEVASEAPADAEDTDTGQTEDLTAETDTTEPQEEQTVAEEPIPAPDEESKPTDPQVQAPTPNPEPEPRPSMVPFFVAAVGGGVVAALLGFVAARQLDTAEVPDGPTPEENAATVAALDGRLGALGSQLDEIAGRDMAAVAAAAVTPVTDALSETDARLSALSDQLAELAGRVETIAMRPTATGIEADEFDSALSEFRDQLNATIANAQTEIEAARTEAEEIADEAYSAEQAALARAAWGQVTTALESGVPFSEPLTTLAGLAGAEIPDALSGLSEDGVPTMATLQQTFPDAARAALDAAIRAETGDAPMDRLTSYLRVQSGYRSLTPREGDDPDAILSRVEAALQGGDLNTALAELEALDGPGREALAEWEALAQARTAAIEAADSVSGQLNSN